MIKLAKGGEIKRITSAGRPRAYYYKGASRILRR